MSKPAEAYPLRPFRAPWAWWLLAWGGYSVLIIAQHGTAFAETGHGAEWVPILGNVAALGLYWRMLRSHIRECIRTPAQVRADQAKATARPLPAGREGAEAAGARAPA